MLHIFNYAHRICNIVIELSDFIKFFENLKRSKTISN